MTTSMWLDPAMATSQEFFRGTVTVGRREHELVVGARGIQWDTTTVALDDIIGVGYDARPCVVNFVQRGVARSVVVRHRVHGVAWNQLEIDLGRSLLGSPDGASDAYQALTTVLHGLVEPRLRLEIAARVIAGDLVGIGDLSISAVGVHIPRRFGADRHVVWSELPLATLEDDCIVVRAGLTASPIVVATLGPSTMNAVMLPELLDELLTQLLP